MDNSEGKKTYTSYRASNGKNPYTPFIYSMVLAFGVMLGFVVNTVTTGKKSILERRYDKIENILDYINLKYVDTVNRKQLLDKTIDEMLSNLDPHSVYIPATEVSEVNEALEGNFEGIGIEFYIVQDTITVVSAIPGGPSEMVGIKAGDRIVTINDSIVAGVKVKDTDVKRLLRGAKGTTVNVGILRSGRKGLIDFTIKRDKIPLYSIDAAYMLDKETGYIKISNFSSTTHAEFLEKMRALQAEGMKKLVIDLRGNPGGYLQAATSIADELISGYKLIVYTEGKAYGRQDYKAGKDGVFEKGDLSILIDQGSASASEILSGAVQDWDRGTIIGRTSFGKGLVQEQYELRDGSALRLTVARYYTPSGRCIQRPYTHGSEEYYNEIYERYMHGEFVHEDSIASTDTTLYRTADGRRVYGGGGIRPDIFVPIDTSSDNDYFYAVRSFVPEFTYKYSSQHSGFLDKYSGVQDFEQHFNLSPEIMNEFYDYAVKSGLKRDAKRDAAIAAKLKVSMEAFLAKQKWRLEGYYFISNTEDKVIQVALHHQNVLKAEKP